MRPSSFLTLVLLILLVKAQGIRLQHRSNSVHQNILEEKTKLIGIEVADAEAIEKDVVLCNDGKFAGRSRKLLAMTPSAAAATTTSTSTTTTTESVKNGGSKVNHSSKHGRTDDGFNRNEEHFKVKSEKESEHREAAHGRYPDIIDIAGMDYSPAKRKPPIHN